jgi:hypothetical protein
LSVVSKLVESSVALWTTLVNWTEVLGRPSRGRFGKLKIKHIRDRHSRMSSHRAGLGRAVWIVPIDDQGCGIDRRLAPRRRTMRSDRVDPGAARPAAGRVADAPDRGGQAAFDARAGGRKFTGCESEKAEATARHNRDVTAPMVKSGTRKWPSSTLVSSSKRKDVHQQNPPGVEAHSPQWIFSTDAQS